MDAVPHDVVIRPANDADLDTGVRDALRTDPAGCWVAEMDGEVVGHVTSRVRELMWVLSSFAVRREQQLGGGIGPQLLTAAMHHGRGCLRGMLTLPDDPDAVGLIRRAGFTLHPQMLLRGEVRRSDLPGVERVRPGSRSDLDLLDSVDRRTRGAAHGSDHDLLLARARLAVLDHSGGSGYAFVDESGVPVLLAATNRRTAAALLWDALATTAPGSTIEVPNVTAANAWAIDVGLEAGLEVHQSGYLAVRGMRPPATYLHHGRLL